MKNIIRAVVVFLIISIIPLTSQERGDFQEYRKWQKKNIKMLQGQGYLPQYLTGELTPFTSKFLNANTIEEENRIPQNESSIAVNPKNPLNLIASAVDYRPAPGTNVSGGWVYISNDGGKSWTNKALGLYKNDWSNGNDPSVSFDGEGNGYVMYGSFVNTGGMPNSVLISRTTDEGETWTANIPVISRDTVSDTFEDKYYVEVDKAISSPYYGTVYTPWKRMNYTDSSTQIVFSKSLDKGDTWSDPVNLSPRKEYTINHITWGQSYPLLTTGANGEIYAVWNDGTVNGVGFNKSLDGGATWNEPRIIRNYETFGTEISTSSGKKHSVKNIRAETYPVVKCDYSDSEWSGNLYVTYAGGEVPDIFFSRSTDKGDTWSESKIIHSDTKNDQFWQWMDIDPISGHIAIMYLDSRNDDENFWSETWVSLSTDGGETWTDRQVSDYRSNISLGVNGVFSGDYSGCAFYDGIVYPSWVDMRNTYNNGNSANNDVYTAVINTRAPSPVEDFEIAMDPNTPTELSLSWTPVMESTFGVELTKDDFNIVIKRNDEIIKILAGDSKTFNDTELTPFERYDYEIIVANQTDSSMVMKSFAYPSGAKEPDVAEILSFDSYNLYVDLKIVLPTLRADLETELVNLSGLDIYREGELVKSVDLESSQVGDTIEIIDDTLEEEGFYHYQVKVKADFVDGETEEQISDFSNEILAWVGEIKDPIYRDDEVENMYISGKWREEEGFSRGGKSWTISDGDSYSANQNDTLIFPPFRSDGIWTAEAKNENGELQSEDGMGGLEFYHTYAVRNGDFGKVIYSLDTMKSWNILGEFSQKDHEEWGDGELTEDDWQRFDEQFLAGKDYDSDSLANIYYAFVFNSNAFSEAEGWFIDEINFRPYFGSGIEDEKAESHLDVFPNPSQNVIYVSNLGENLNLVEINISSVSGVDIKADILVRENDIRVDVSALQPGIYFIRAGHKMQKFVKL
jgi:Secretion system C-terminal sorting domain